MSGSGGWVAVDLDGTLAHYDQWRGVEHIGEPIVPMVERVKRWLDEGRDARIFTARVWDVFHNPDADAAQSLTTVGAIQTWCQQHIGRILPITCTKDYGMVELWDDRAVQVRQNEGYPIGYSTRGLD